MLGYFVWKITILRQKIIFFSNIRGDARRVRPLDPPLLYIALLSKLLIFVNPLHMVYWTHYPGYIKPPTHGIVNPLPMVIWPPTQCISNPCPRYIKPPTNGVWPFYPWHIEPSTHSMSNSLLWYYEPPYLVKMKNKEIKIEPVVNFSGVQIHNLKIYRLNKIILLFMK